MCMPTSSDKIEIKVGDRCKPNAVTVGKDQLLIPLESSAARVFVTVYRHLSLVARRVKTPNHLSTSKPYPPGDLSSKVFTTSREHLHSALANERPCPTTRFSR